MLYRGEVLTFIIIGTVALVMAILLMVGETRISWPEFRPVFVVNGAIIAFGLVLRLRPNAARISITMVALGLYPIFSSLLALVFSLSFPLHRPLIDDQLFAMDVLLGYDWVHAVEWLAQYPLLAKGLAAVYISSLGQLLILLLFLGLTLRVSQLHHLLLTGMLGAVMTYVFWIVWPSFGPSAYLSPDPAAVEATSLLVTPSYGAQLMHLAEFGQEVIYRHEILGTVAFPSFHIVMAVLAVWFARGTLLFWPFLLLNLPMLPATAIHGGHHLIDLPAGIALFALACLIAERLLRTARSATTPPVLARA